MQDEDREQEDAGAETAPAVESTADLIMRRAEQIGDFDQFIGREEEEAEAPIEGTVLARANNENGIRVGGADEGTEVVLNGVVDEHIEFTLGPDGFKPAEQQTNDDDGVADDREAGVERNTEAIK